MYDIIMYFPRASCKLWSKSNEIYCSVLYNFHDFVSKLYTCKKEFVHSIIYVDRQMNKTFTAKLQMSSLEIYEYKQKNKQTINN